MLLERLSLENYGLYASRSRFVFSSTQKKPIVLVGGLNGAGKTTILEAIMVALYGKTYLGRRATKKEYLEFISGKVHRHRGKRATSASVEIVFRFYHSGSENEYAVGRHWTIEGASVTEKLSVQKNGAPMTDVDESQWQVFIEGLIPLGIAKLFFFDGEKIVRITKWDRRSNDEMRLAFDALMGADLVSRLRSDLDLYMLRNSGRGDGAHDAQKEYEALLEEKSQISMEIDVLAAEHDEKGASIEEIRSKITQKESKIASVGGGYATIRDRLLAQKTALAKNIGYRNKLLQQQLSEDAPLYITSKLLTGIRQQVENDIGAVSQASSALLARDKIKQLKKEMESKEFWPAGIDGSKISKMICMRLDGMFEAPHEDAFFDISPRNASWLSMKIESILGGPQTLSQSLREYAKEKSDLHRVESDLAKIPKDDELGPRISEINAMHEELGILMHELAHIEQQLASKRSYLRIIQNRLKRLIDAIHSGKTATAGTLLASKMQQALDAYIANLKERKMRELESNLLSTTRLLLHKELIHRINIDRETFEIRVYDDADDQIMGGLLSMGERQIVGTALLWAVAKTCGRPLPFVIDTPLGRLDGEHLSNLVERFYPFASHQIILLSTDREIGHKEYVKLSEYVSRSYRITCDRAASITTITPGYFMEERIA